MEEYPHLVSVGVSAKPFGWHSLFNLSRLNGPVDNEATESHPQLQESPVTRT
jgi:hypothetical protein